MIPADGQTVPVAGDGHDLSGRPGGLETDGCRNGSPVQHLQHIGMQVHRNPGAAADPGGQCQIVSKLQFLGGVRQRLDDHAVAATGTENHRKEVLPEVFFTNGVHRFSSRNRRNSSGCG